MKNRIARTDLALELKEDIEKEESLDGIEVYTKISKDNDLKETHIKVVTKEGSDTIGKPIGTYITIESDHLRENDEGIHEPFVESLNRCLVNMIGDKKKILVVGLGNRGITPDALGPYVVDNLFISKHLIQEEVIEGDGEISAIAPGVMAQTGIETVDIIEGIVKKTMPDVVIAIDALAARNSDRLNRTIQVCDTGINPGSGVGNNRKELSEKTLGVKVIAIGVPTVISVPAIVNDSMEKMLDALDRKEIKKVFDDFSEEEKYQLASELVEPYFATMFVTPKNIDEAVKKISYTISEGINKLINLW